MDLTHRFTVPTGVEEAWAHFQDIEGVAGCFPGAVVSSVEGDTFHGSVKVKLGPIALVYNGSGTFVEKDETAHRFVVDAKGKDKRGNGTAGAMVTLSMTESTSGDSTDVEVVTDLAITGKPAQFGRGVMQDVSDKLLGQFVDCLEAKLTGEDGTADVPPAAAAAPAVPPQPRGADTIFDAAADTVGAPAAPPTPPEPAGVTPHTGTHRGPRQDDALDLGAAVLPILARTYWKQALAAVAVAVLVAVVVKTL